MDCEGTEEMQFDKERLRYSFSSITSALVKARIYTHEFLSMFGLAADFMESLV